MTQSWKYDALAECVENESGVIIADVFLRKHGPLLAAAPDLLEALEMARECIAYCRRAHQDAQTGKGVPVETFIDAAIAKATGETAIVPADPDPLPDPYETLKA